MTDRPLTIEEATKFLEVSDKTIRRMLERGMLQEQERDRGRIVITAASLNAAAEQLAHERGQADQEAQLILASQAALLNLERERHAVELRAKEERINELVAEVATLKTDQKYMVSNEDKIAYERRIAELEAVIKVIQQQMTDQREKPPVGPQPKPWWKFW
jgi:excisionase family DNA binding protein